MNRVELLSNLYALRQLYGLLQNSEDGLQRINSNNVGKSLDVRARQLLKYLLDDATEKIFNTHSKIIAAQSAVYSTPCSSQPEQPKDMPKLSSPLSSATEKYSGNIVLNYGKDSKRCNMTSRKDEESPKKSQGAIPESKISISTDLPGHKKKQCRICLENNLKKQYSVKESKISTERANVPGSNSKNQVQQHDWLSHLNEVDKQAKRSQESNRKAMGRENGIGETLGNPSIFSLGSCSSISPTTGASKQEVGFYRIGQFKEKSDEASDYPKVIANAIKRIEFGILALQLSSSDLADSFNNDENEHCSFNLDTSVSPTPPIVQTEEQVVTTTGTRREVSDMGESLPLLGGTQSLTCLACQLSQKHENPTGMFASKGHESSKANMERRESLSQPVSQNCMMAGYVNGLRVPTQDEVAMKPPSMHAKAPGQGSQANVVQNLAARKKSIARSKLSMPPQSMEFKASSVGVGPVKTLSQTCKRDTTSQRHHQVLVRPVLLDEHKPSERRWSQKMSYVSRQKRGISHKQALEEEESSSSTANSQTWSTWTSELTETESIASSNESEEDYWSPSESTRGMRDIHRRMRGDFSSSRRSINVAAEESSSSARDSSLEAEEESLYSHKRYPDKSIGRLRRLKNRLGLIFHHHHHHHHHHHGNVNSDNDHGPSAWKHLRKMMVDGRKNRHGIGEHRGGGVRKSVAKRNNQQQQQVGHFHALVGGLLRHARHSKKSNKVAKRNGPGQSHFQGQGRGRLNKKLHWWQMFRRGGVKLPKTKRGRVKVGFTTKRRRPRLKMK